MEYELFFKRQTLLLDLSPRIKVKSKKKKEDAEDKYERENDWVRKILRMKESKREKLSER